MIWRTVGLLGHPRRVSSSLSDVTTDGGGRDSAPAATPREATLDELVPWLPELPWLGVAISDTTSRKVVRANGAFLELVGRTRADLAAGLDVLEITGSESKSETDQGFDRLRTSGVVDLFAKTYVHPDGTERRAWVTGVLVPHATRFAFVYTLDVTEREAAVDALRESEERGRRFAQASFEGLFIHDRGIIIDANEPLTALLGATREQIIGRSAFDFADPSSHEELRRHVADQYEAPYEAIGRRLDGSTFPIELLGKPLPSFGRTLRVTAVRDISDRKRAEAALREAESALLQAQKIESLGLLAGGIAHDFNNILGIVLGFAAIAQKDVAPGSAASDALVEIERATMRAAELARQMLVYSGRSPKSVTQVSVNAVVVDMARLLESSFSKKVELLLDLAPERPCTVADRTQLQQLVLNLLTNAAEAIGTGRGVIRVATRRVELLAGAVAAAQPGVQLAAGSYIELCVHDDGAGMDEATLARIFDPFFTTKSAGRGLGLSATLGILRGHGAGFSMESRPGSGTSFRIYFRVQAQPQHAASAPLPVRRVSRSGTILLVDDEGALRRSTRKILESVGYVVLEANDGDEAVAIFRSRHAQITLVLLDLVMPRSDGREALAAIRSIDCHARVVLMSGYDANEVVDGIRADVAGFLAKPYPASALLAAVDAALAH